MPQANSLRRPLAGPALDPGRRLWALLLLALGLVAAGARPVWAIDWLVLVVDRSKSIDELELALQRSAYVRLLSDEGVIGALGNAQVAIVEFDTRAEVVVDWTDAASAARAYGSQPVNGMRGQTAIGSALSTAVGLLSGKNGRLVIDVSGDGRENVDPQMLAQARAAASARAIEVNGLAILNDQVPGIDNYYNASVVNGFVLPVEQGDDFASALRRKLFYEIAGSRPPEHDGRLAAVAIAPERRRNQ